MNRSSIWTQCRRAEGVVNGRYVAECSADIGHPAGTIVCDPAPPDTGDDLTFTYKGVRYMDDGQFTPRVQITMSDATPTVTRGNDLIFPRGNEKGDYSEPLWIASLDGLKAHGRTPEEAIQNLLTAGIYP